MTTSDPGSKASNAKSSSGKPSNARLSDAKVAHPVTSAGKSSKTDVAPQPKRGVKLDSPATGVKSGVSKSPEKPDALPSPARADGPKPSGRNEPGKAARAESSRSSTNVPPAPPAKPRKPNAGFSNRELENFRDLLLAKRRELIGDMGAMEYEALRGSGASNLSNLPIHMADMGTDNYEQEFTLGLVQKDRDLLKEINRALSKMQNGAFGYCEGTGEPINKERLEYQPWARYSVEHQRKLERHGR